MPQARRAGFTLIELLTVIVIVSVLAVLIVAAIRAAQVAGERGACLGNLRQVGAGIGFYAADHEACIPFGPPAGKFQSPSNLYPSTGAPTSLISLASGGRVALGLILDYLRDPKVLFCPGSDQKVSAEEELKKVGKRQAQGSYYYRHAGNTELFDMPHTNLSPPNIRLGNLGENRRGLPVRALAMDTLFECSDALDQFNVRTRTHHNNRFVNILYADGHSESRSNDDRRYSVDVRNSGQIHQSFDIILRAFEAADAPANAPFSR